MTPHRTTAGVLAFLIPSLAVAQTAGPYPSLVYTFSSGTGSVDPSLTAAITTGNAPAISILGSQGSDTETAQAPMFPTTATVGPTTASSILTSFTFTSGQPGEVLSSNTRPEFTASGTINLSTGVQGASQSPLPNSGVRMATLEWRGAWGTAVAGAAGVMVGALML